MYSKLFTPKKIGNCEIPNRLVVPAMVTNYCTDDGILTERYIRYMEEKAKGGWGLLITEDYAVDEHGKGYQRIPGFWNDEQIEGNKELTRRIHAQGSKIFCQMYHPGRQSSHAVNGNVQPVAPSGTKDPICRDLAREMTIDEIHDLVRKFGDAAGRCKKAGFDGIELHCAHGYLLAEFLSPYVNKRVDEYGGCFENRVRIVDEVIASMRAQVGPDFPIMARISGNEYVQGGRTEAESFELARHLEEAGFNAIHVSNGCYAAPAEKQIIAPMFTEHALNMNTAEQIKNLVHVPVVVTNRINDPKMADTLLVMGKADFIGMGRGSLTDPYLPKKAQEMRNEQINYCIGCVQGCEMKLFTGESVTCLVNPRVGLEYQNDLKKVEQPKKVLVAGGGPAGLIAARTAAQRGHKVVVYEASNHLGGQFRAAAYPIGKGELSTMISSYRANLEELGVPIHLGTEVTEEIIKEEQPDSIILATGAKPMTPPIPGIDLPNVCTAESILYGKTDIKDGPIVVCGGGEVGCETGQYLSEKNPDVTIVEMLPEILRDMAQMTKPTLLKMMKENGVRVHTSYKVKEIREDGVICEDKDGNEEFLPAVQVVSAFGYRAYNPLEELARKYCSDVHVIGCAVKAGNALTATKEGYEAGLSV